MLHASLARGAPSGRRLPLAFTLLAASLACAGCTRGPKGPTSAAPPPKVALPAAGEGFTDVTAASGIDFVHSFGDLKFSNLVEAVGSGAAWLDYDGDGWIDVYIATGKHQSPISTGKAPARKPLNRLYRNRGDGTLEDVTERAGVGCPSGYSMGVAAGDYDNDGRPDIYVCNHGPNVLYRNRGDGTFEDATERAGVGDPRCSAAATWLDYDLDGWIDLYVGNYIRFDPKYNLYYAPDGFPGPLAYAAEEDRLYRNRGDGTFEDVTATAGLTKAGRAMSVAAVDLNADGLQDIYVSNDAMENYLYWNEGGGRFREDGLEAGVAYNAAGDSTSHMAVDFGDYDGDARLDIFVSDSSISSLFRNEGAGGFNDVCVAAGIGRESAQFVGWGAFFFDLENDGDLDIFKVNADLSRLFGQEPQVFENTGAGAFRDASERLGDFFRREWMSRGSAPADYDNDGDLDVLVVNLDSPATLLRNDAARGSWIEVELRGGRGRLKQAAAAGSKLSSRDGLGAKVLVTAGGRTQLGERRAGGSYLSQADPRLHFGLGAAERVERIEVRWPSGKTQVIEAPPTRKLLVVEETP